MALLEAGIGQAARNALYEPVTRRDRGEISRILSVSRSYYWHITKYYALGIAGLSLLLPAILKTSVDHRIVSLLVLFEGMSGVIRFLFIENWSQLLAAEGKQYVKANISLLNRVLTYAVKIILAYFHVNIALIQAAFFVISLVQLLIYFIYIRRNYGWIEYQTAGYATEKLADRNAFVLTEIAWTVFSSTDMILLSMMYSTALASVYAVYNLVYNNLSMLLNAVYTGLIYILGQTWHSDRERYREIHDGFEMVFAAAIGILMSVCSVMMPSFISLYTSGVTDVDYTYKGLPLLFGLVQIFSWNRFVSGNLTGIAGYAGKISRISVIEAALNISLSAVLAVPFGIYGILAATVLALSFKLVYLTWFSNRVIMERKPNRSVRTILLNLGIYLAVTAFAWGNPIQAESIGAFILWGIASSAVIAGIYLLLNGVCSYRLILPYLKKALRLCPVFRIFSSYLKRRDDKKSYPYELTCAAIVKNEGNYIREWIAFHRLAGADHIILYDNESDDGLTEIIADFIQSGYVEYQYIEGRGRQCSAYNDCVKRLRRKSRYIAFIDGDEFLVPLKEKALGQTVREIMSESPNAGGLAVNWRMFGSGGHVNRPEGLVTENFLYRAKDFGEGNGCIKSVVNPRFVWEYRHAHYPVYYPGFYNVDEAGQTVCGPYHMDQKPEKIRINHYFTKSREEWIRRRSMGRASIADANNKRTIQDFEKYDQNDIYDDLMLNYTAKIRRLVNTPLLFGRKKDCCGCTACVSICPTDSIVMTEDSEGFLYPQIREESCIRCGRCREVCSFQELLRRKDGGKQEKFTGKVYAARAKDREILRKSSSGGMFTVLSDWMLEQGGAVAASVYSYEEQSAHFRLITDRRTRDLARGSKYMQSIAGDIYEQCFRWLQGHSGQKLMFVGMGCQAAGFKKYMTARGLQDRIYTVDIICHGSPSPRLWREYAGQKETKCGARMKRLDFKDKRNGWLSPAAVAEIGEREVSVSDYVRLFYNRCALRPSCHQCPYAQAQRTTDLTIGDYWGIEKKMPDFYDREGNSLVLVHTEEGGRIFREIGTELDSRETVIRKSMQMNLEHPTPESPVRAGFWERYESEGIEGVLNF